MRPSRRRRSKSAFARRRFFLRMTSLTGGPYAIRRAFTDLYCQALATFLSPGLEDSAPSLGLHPSPKAVHPLAAAHLGLPRSFRHSDYLSKSGLRLAIIPSFRTTCKFPARQETFACLAGLLVKGRAECGARRSIDRLTLNALNRLTCVL